MDVGVQFATGRGFGVQLAMSRAFEVHFACIDVKQSPMARLAGCETHCISAAHMHSGLCTACSCATRVLYAELPHKCNIIFIL